MLRSTHQAAVAVMQQEVTLQGCSREVIHAARPKSDVPHDEALVYSRKPDTGAQRITRLLNPTHRDP